MVQLLVWIWLWYVCYKIHGILEQSNINTFTHRGKHKQHVIHWFSKISYKLPYEYLCIV